MSNFIKFVTKNYGVIEWDRSSKEMYFETGDIVVSIDKSGEFVHPLHGWRFRISLVSAVPTLEQVVWERTECNANL